MAEETETKEEEQKKNILVFPAKLRSQVENGGGHVRFKALDGDNSGPVVHLFIPQGFSVPDAASYGTIELGIMGGAEATRGNVDSITAADIKGQASTIGSIVGAKMGASGMGALLGGLSALRQGIASNPYTETQYTGSNIRSFGFTFKLVAESSEEADTALAIEQFFREHMYPEEQGAFTLKYPDRFKIEFYNGSEKNKYMPFINECYLISFNTTYNSTTNAFHDKGQPVEIDIAATFQETKALTRTGLYEGGDGSSKRAKEGGAE
jgi:hypothetical protein